MRRRMALKRTGGATSTHPQTHRRLWGKQEQSGTAPSTLIPKKKLSTSGPPRRPAGFRRLTAHPPLPGLQERVWEPKGFGVSVLFDQGSRRTFDRDCAACASKKTIRVQRCIWLGVSGLRVPEPQPTPRVTLLRSLRLQLPRLKKAGGNLPESPEQGQMICSSACQTTTKSS